MDYRHEWKHELNYLDLLTLWFQAKFGVKPMHFFGLLGSLMFLLGFIAVIVVGAFKLYNMYSGNSYRLVTESPYFYLSLTLMILGTQLFLTGFLGELIIRHSYDRNHYEINDKLIDENTTMALPSRQVDELPAQAIETVKTNASHEAQ